MDRFQQLRLLEAILFATAEPVREKDLAARMPLPLPQDISDELERRLGVRITKVHVEIRGEDLPPTTADVSSGWKGSTNKRTIGAGKKKTLKLNFAKKAAANGYDITATFESGCTVNVTQ